MNKGLESDTLFPPRKESLQSDPASIKKQAWLHLFTLQLCGLTPLQWSVWWPQTQVRVLKCSPKSKLMPWILPKSKEVMIQSSWNKTAAEARPQNVLPFLENHERRWGFTPALHSFPFQPCTVLTIFVKITKFLVAVAMNSNDGL